MNDEKSAAIWGAVPKEARRRQRQVIVGIDAPERRRGDRSRRPVTLGTEDILRDAEQMREVVRLKAVKFGTLIEQIRTV